MKEAVEVGWMTSDFSCNLCGSSSCLFVNSSCHGLEIHRLSSNRQLSSGLKILNLTNMKQVTKEDRLCFTVLTLWGNVSAKIYAVQEDLLTVLFFSFVFSHENTDHSSSSGYCKL